MKDIVIVSQAPLTPQILRNNYVNEYQHLGHKVLFWDLSQMIHPGMTFNDQINEEYVSRISKLDELERKLSVCSDKTCFIFDFDPSWKLRKLFSLFSNYSAKTIRVDMYANTSLHRSTAKKLLDLCHSGGFRKMRNKISLCLFLGYKKFYKIKDFDKIASSSRYVYRDFPINHPDYDDYMFGKSVKPTDGKYFVFVDTFFGQHPDDKYIYNYTKEVDLERYFSSLNNYFDYLELKYKIPVIIAAHPKAEYKNEFGKRQIIKYRSKDLIRYSEGVILQICNTMSWVCLADKPVMLVTCKEYDSFNNYHNLFKLYGDTVKLPIYNIDEIDFSQTQFNKIENEARLNYIYGYLTSKETASHPNQIILSQHIENL